MSRKSFFSFHYNNDVSRTNIVRNSWVTKDREAAGFFDSADFEKVKKEDDNTIKKWIQDQLHGTSVTVVLIGSETNSRKYVKYELQKSYERGNGILGIYIHQIKNLDGKTSTKGSNQFGEIGKNEKGESVYLSAHYPCYDWLGDDGYNNMGKWIENAAAKAGK